MVFDEPCDVSHSIKYQQTEKWGNDSLLFFFTLKNSSLIRYVPIVVNNNGYWKVGSAFDGEPQKIINDDQGGYWMYLQSFNAGTSPSLYYSRDGTSWDYIALPEKRQRGSTIEEIQKICYQDNKLLITLYTEIFIPKNKIVISSWKAEPKKLLEIQRRMMEKRVLPVVWHQVENEAVKKLDCQLGIITNNNLWVIKKNKQGVTLQHERKGLKFMINSMMTVPVNNRIRKASYSIQVGVYQNKAFANELIRSLQNAGFRTYTKELPVKGIRMIKIYIGSFGDKRLAQQKLVELKQKFADRKPIQSAFLVKS